MFVCVCVEAYQKVIIPGRFLADLSKMPDSIIDIESTLRAVSQYDTPLVLRLCFALLKQR